MKTVYVIGYQHIDSTFLTIPASQADDEKVRDMLPCSLTEAQNAFAKAGWEGDGRITFIWLPPFLFRGAECWGVCVWHVKQGNNGTSWLCASKPLSFPGFVDDWQPIEI